MAEQISPRLEASYRFPNLLQLQLKVKSSGLRSIWRRQVRNLWPSSVRGTPGGEPGVTNELEAVGETFRNQGWAFVEEIWAREFFTKLTSHWPPDRFLSPIRYVTKGYDSGFRWARSSESSPDGLEEFPAIFEAYRYLRSEAFCKRVSKICGDTVERKCSHILLTRSYWGSNIIPHIDSITSPHNVNVIFFIDGTGGLRGGGLGIWEDNEFKKPIFIPENLKNTCLLYDMSKTFYHGFPPMKFGSFRWTINAAYSP